MKIESLVKALREARVRLIAGASVVLRDLHQAEDVFQEVLVRDLRMRESFFNAAGLLASARVAVRPGAADVEARRDLVLSAEIFKRREADG